MSKKLLIIILFLSSCVVGPDYKRPEVSTPLSWLGFNKFSTEENSPIISENIDQKWWRNFDDEVLNQIIELVIADNLDLKIAESKIIESRANIGKETSYLAPKINAGGSATRSSKIFNPANPNKHKPINIFDAGFDASWEIDLFGAVHRAKESFLALFDAVSADKNAIQISLIGEAARNYMQVRSLQNQIAVHKKSIMALEQIVKLSADKRRAGLINDVDLVKVQTELFNEESVIPDLDNDLNSSILRLETLCGKQPGDLRELLRPKLSLPQINKNVIVSAPIDIIRNRPDIKEAERNLASATALQGVAISQRYPKISLTGFFGFQNTRSGNLFRNSSKAFSLGSGITAPIFDFGGISSDIKISKARKEQALLGYKSSILRALEDVENALTSYANNQEKLKISAKSLAVNQLSINLMAEKYQKGLISLPDLLSAKVNFYGIHNSFIQNQTDLNISLIALYKSLGGGWE